MQRIRIGLVLTLAITACSGKASAPQESSPRAVAADPAGGPAVEVPPPDPREAALAKHVLRLFENEHLLRKRMDDEVSRAAFKTYMERIDGGKMFLLAADRDALSKHADTIDDELRAGSLELAHDGAKLFVARVAVVDKIVSELLAKPFNHGDEEFLELDPKKVELAKDDQEIKDRWRRRLELEVLERVAQMEARLNPDPTAAKPVPKAAPSPQPPNVRPRVPPTAPPPPTRPDVDGDDDDRAAGPISKIPPTPEARDAKAREDLAKSYAGRFARLRNPGPLDAASDVINAVASVLDPHTTYLPPADKANFDIQMSGSLEGIGAVLRERDHYVEVSELVPGGASWREGSLSPGDLIMSVQSGTGDPVDVTDMRIDDVVKMIRGPKGTVVRLHVLKPAGNEDNVAITRDVIVIEESYARGAIVTPKGRPTYGYIHLPSFYGGRGNPHTSAGDIKRLLGEMKGRKVAGVVLDIRGNGGGLLGDAIEMTGELIDQGPVVQVQDNHDRREVLGDEDAGTDYDGPLVVLVDRFSASASEIVAGALQDYHRAVIVGTGPTHGKGTVQTLADLDRATGGKLELGSLKITIQQFFRVSGSSTQRQGVVPDVVLPDPAAHVESGERELEHAIAWSQIQPAPHGDWRATWQTPALVQKSAARVAKQPLLAKLATATQVLKARRDDTRVPLQKAAWENRRKELKVALEAASPDFKSAPQKFGVKVIDDPNAPQIAARPDGKADDRIARWSENLAKDPWVDECLNILGDLPR